MSGPEKRGFNRRPEIHAGFIPLVDCAPLVMARELGFDEAEGFRLVLHREVSWANIRDKVDVGLFDCAHMLAPMPIAAMLGLGRATAPLIVPMALSLNGNAITVSNSLYEEMSNADPAASRAGGMAAARPLAEVVRLRQERGDQPLSLGIVYPFSCHNYDLRYWLGAAGIDPDDDVNLLVIPPPLLAESLEAGRIDGFCVGAPWGAVSVADAEGVIIATKNELWPMSPEKVLGVREAWAVEHPDLLGALVRAVTKAARWLDQPENRFATAARLAQSHYVGVAEAILAQPLTGALHCGGGQPIREDRDMIVFHRDHATFPWRSHALWLMSQMIRWGQVRAPFDLAALATRVYRPDIYRAAVAGIETAVPVVDYKVEEAGQFFGAERFDPQSIMTYIAGHHIRSASLRLADFETAGSGG